jgi:uroporphyrinogen-III synthase
VVSSVTAVQALEAKAAERGVELGRWLPGNVQVATVGPATRRVLEARGIAVDLAPTGRQSGAGLLDIWPEGKGTVLLPQADIADARLRRGLAARGAFVQAVTAYHTVDYPADPGRRLPGCPSVPGAPDAATGPAAPVLSAAEARAEIAAGTLQAVVAASPSAARRIKADLGPLGACRFVAIGRSTAAQAEALGLTVASVAEVPTASGLVAAVVESLTLLPASSSSSPHPPAAESTAKDPA